MSRQRRRFRDLAWSPVPFGLHERKPRHFRGMLRVLWENRDSLPYAWKVLTRGVCDGCALGTAGLRDWTLEGSFAWHLCMVRLELLRLNTMPALDPALLADVGALGSRSSAGLRALGRLPFPMRRRRGEAGFTRVGWEELWAEVGARWRDCTPERTAMYLTSRGITNEVYYVAQKVMRFLGSPHVDNSARLCHAPSTAGLKSTLGVAATTCSYRDWYDADLIVFFGANPANDQPVTTKYLLEARRRGARVLAVNAFREPGMERYWVPSNPLSALFGTRLLDRCFLVRVGGDRAFLTAVQKVVLERGWHAEGFVQEATSGYAEYRRALAAQPMDRLLAAAGTSLQAVEDFAREVAEAGTGVFVWSMGITQHATGSDNVRAIVNLALLREFVGRPGCGLMPIRGHSGVQGGAEMGAYSTVLPGGLPVDAASAARFQELWGFPVPSRPGWTTPEMLAAARRGKVEALYCIGGNFLETMPAPDQVREALARIPLRLHSDIVLTSQMLVEPAETVYLLPARTRYEQRDGGTETTTERRVVFSPEIPGHQVGEARSEWELLLDLARAVRPEEYARVHFASGQAIREDIARSVPFYRGIEKLTRAGDQFQYGGPHLCAGRRFPTADGRAHFAVVDALAGGGGRDGRFRLATRRGKQFNSMIQGEVDPLTGAARDHVLMAPADAVALGLGRDEPVLLRSEHGEMPARVFPADVAVGTLQAHWPEANVLLPPERRDPEGGVPDYNADVEVLAPDGASLQGPGGAQATPGEAHGGRGEVAEG